MKREPLILPLPDHEGTLTAITNSLDRETHIRSTGIMALLIESMYGAGFHGRLYRGQAMAVRDGKTTLLDDAIVYEFMPGDPAELPELAARIFGFGKVKA